jgi:DNA-binding XRE family transcriptional regulator
MQSTTEMLAGGAPTGARSIYANPQTPSFNWNNVVLTALFLVGTGGFALPQVITMGVAIPSGPIAVRIMGGLGDTVDADRALDTQEKLAGIRRYLSMNVTDMARALRVARPTVYSWFRDGAALRGRHLDRVEAIYGIARYWRKISSQPVGTFLTQPLVSGDSLIELLSAKALNEPDIQGAFAQIQKALSRSSGRAGILDVGKKQGLKLATIQPPVHWTSNEDVDL